MRKVDICLKNLRSRLFPLEDLCVLCNGQSVSGGLICDPCWGDLSYERPSCRCCGRSTNQDGFCVACLHNSGNIDGTLTLLPYEFPVARLLLSLKYKYQLALAHESGRKIAEKAGLMGGELPEYIVTVPLHPSRLYGRGYNQALEISRAVGRGLRIPVGALCARRIRNTLPQFKLTPKQRRKNIQGAFTVKKNFYGRRAAIVDDIVTAGHTTNGLALQLRAAGARNVLLWACAHAG